MNGGPTLCLPPLHVRHPGAPALYLRPRYSQLSPAGAVRRSRRLRLRDGGRRTASPPGPLTRIISVRGPEDSIYPEPERHDA